MQFRAVVELGGKTATGLAVPDEVVEALGAGRWPAVLVRIGETPTGPPWRAWAVDS